jgi:hypothetical protein
MHATGVQAWLIIMAEAIGGKGYHLVYMATSRNTEGSTVREKENAVMLWARFWAEETSEGSSATQFRSRCGARPPPTQHPGGLLTADICTTTFFGSVSNSCTGSVSDVGSIFGNMALHCFV